MKNEQLLDSILEYSEIVGKQEGGWWKYEEWYRKSNFKSWSRTYCYYLVRAARSHKGEISFSKLNAREKGFYEKISVEGPKFIEVAKTFIAESGRDNFVDKKWFFYFLSVAERKSKHLKIARALLETSIGNVAELENVVDGFSKDYSGTYEIIKGNRKVIYFDLKDDPVNTTRELHIKAVYMNPNDEIMLGTYTTYDEQFVYSGLIVLHQITNEKFSEDEMKPILCSYRLNSKAFIAIPEAIKQYLSLKKRNYRSVPRTVPSLDELQVYLDEYVPLKNKKNRFLELEIPRVYLATPQGSSKQNGSSEKVGQPQNVDKLILEIEGALKNEKVQLISKQTNSNMPASDLKSIDSLKLLKRTRFFILVITNVNKASYSLVQLGWALAHCKYIMLIYNDLYVSDRIKSISTNVINKHIYKSLSSEKERREIANAIRTFVHDNMEKFVDSNLEKD